MDRFSNKIYKKFTYAKDKEKHSLLLSLAVNKMDQFTAPLVMNIRKKRVILSFCVTILIHINADIPTCLQASLLGIPEWG